MLRSAPSGRFSTTAIRGPTFQFSRRSLRTVCLPERPMPSTLERNTPSPTFSIQPLKKHWRRSDVSGDSRARGPRCARSQDPLTLTSHGPLSMVTGSVTRGGGLFVSELRKDPTRGQWVLVRPRSGPRRATDDCPFCAGNEGLTPPEIAAYRKEGSIPNGPGWDVRAIPERDPYFQLESDLVREGVGMYDKVGTRGASELIIESPGHEDTWATMGEEQVTRVFWMYRDRLEDLKRDAQVRDILITRRHKKPGARFTHPYSRVIAIPIIFDEIRLELKEAREYYQYKHRCVYCDIARQEMSARERVVWLTPFFLVIVPYAARSPLETWILPRQHHCAFEAIAPEAVADLARVVTGYFEALARGMDDPSYEMVLHTAPNLRSKILHGEWATIAHDYHWHLEISVRPERGTRLGGIFVNELPPEQAAVELRSAWSWGRSSAPE